MDLSTLNPTKPQDADPVKEGASRIRDVATAVITSFDLEHARSGEHTFITGSLDNRPAPGHNGRLFLNIADQRVEMDNGSGWVMLHGVQFNWGIAHNVVLVPGQPPAVGPGVVFNTLSTQKYIWIASLGVVSPGEKCIITALPMVDLAISTVFEPPDFAFNRIGSISTTGTESLVAVGFSLGTNFGDGTHSIALGLQLNAGSLVTLKYVALAVLAI